MEKCRSEYNHENIKSKNGKSGARKTRKKRRSRVIVANMDLEPITSKSQGSNSIVTPRYGLTRENC